MKAIELLEKYPLATEVVRDWFIRRMMESVNEDDDVPEDFKKFMIDQGVPNERLCIFIDANPRSLFDVFDEHEMFIFIQYMDVKDSVEFFHTFRNIDTNPVKLFKTRKEAELFAIEAAFEILEKKLAPPPVEELEVEGEEIVKE